jgi:hypothetical protein
MQGQTAASLMTPEQHRRQADRLRRTGKPELIRLAQDHENLARVIEARRSETR